MQGFGYVSNMVLHSELSVVELGQVLDTQTYTAPPDAGDVVSGMFITLNKAFPAIPAQCGQTLRLRVSLSGTDGGNIDELGPGDMTIP